MAPVLTLNSKFGDKYWHIDTIRVHVMRFKHFLGVLVHMKKFGDAYVLYFNYLKDLFLRNSKVLLLLL